MIPDYKFYHGAVVTEILQCLREPISLEEINEEGRLGSYVLNGNIGIQIKHSTQRLGPWQFTFTRNNLEELGILISLRREVFVAFVCFVDGIATLSAREILDLIAPGQTEQAWVRIDRRRGGWYSVSGAMGPLARKKPKGVQMIVDAVREIGLLPRSIVTAP
ncbi:MAG: hypothetical protein U1E50_12860 [Caulobacteraceae bacterium]